MTIQISRREQEREDRRRQMLRAARAVFAERGFRKTTLEEIAHKPHIRSDVVCSCDWSHSITLSQVKSSSNVRAAWNPPFLSTSLESEVNSTVGEIVAYNVPSGRMLRVLHP